VTARVSPLSSNRVAKGELDPAPPQNRVIVDLDKASRNPRGVVDYETDFFILRPVDPGRANGVLVYDVTNRCSKRISQLLDDAPGDPRPSLEERYSSREAYVDRVKAAAEALVAERLLLPTDAAAYAAAAEECDRF
jgi:Alpha/beta hydrolase domain